MRKLQFLCVRETQESIAASVHRLIAQQIESLKLPGWTVQKDRIYNAIGTEFTFVGIRTDPAKIKSTEGIDICIVEEAESVSSESWKILIPTIRKPSSEIWVLFNPREKDDPTYQRFIVNPPDDAYVRKVNWRDNPWFPRELVAEKDHCAKVDPDEYAHIWEGECRQRSEAQILRGKWRVEPFEPRPSWDGPYFGLDFGFAQDPNHAVECYIGDGNIWIRRESRSIGLDTDALPDRLTQDIPEIASRELRCDNARPETISYLQRHGLPKALAANKWPNSIEDGIKWLRAHDAIVLHPCCQHLIDEASHWAHKVDRITGEVLPQVVDKHNHGWDAVRYALSPAIRGNIFVRDSAAMPAPIQPIADTPWGTF